MKTIKTLGIILKICSVGNCRCYRCFSINGNILIIRSQNENRVYFRKPKYRKKNSYNSRNNKKIYSLGFELCLIENYGSHIGIKDEQYKDMGVNILKDETEILNSSDIIVQVGMLSEDKTSIIKENQILIGVFESYNNKEKFRKSSKKKK